MNVSVILKMLEMITVHKEVFKSTNPWLGRILGTLNDIEEKLKEEYINTKSEIKGFFLNTDVKKSNLRFSSADLEKNDIPLITRLSDYTVLQKEMR